MQITPNDLGASKELLNSLDPKVLQLINSLANKPLLIEKLAGSQGKIPERLLTASGCLNPSGTRR